MTSTVAIELVGLNDILKQVDSIAKLEGLQAAMLAGATHVKAKVDKYPKSTEANQPRGFNTVYSVSTHRPINTWYERGLGTKRIRKDGSVVVSKKSEMLGRSAHSEGHWKVSGLSGSIGVVVGTNVTYAPYVMDEEKQASFHKRRGWKTVQKIGKDEMPTIMKFIQDYMRKKYGMS